MTLRLATRGSPLALRQARVVQDKLAALGAASELVVVQTTGDRDATTALSVLGGQGVFTVEIQRAVLDHRADVAVHSAKDLPSMTPGGLVLASVPERRDAADALVGRSLAGLGPGSTVATGSPRRRALLLERRPDLNVVGLRGNMARRFAAAGAGGVDAVVVAIAATERLGQEVLVAERLDPTWFVPQVGQGAIALEARVDDDPTRMALSQLNDEVAFLAVQSERAFLNELGAGCSIPVGAHAHVSHGEVVLRGVMLAPDGSKSVRDEECGRDPQVVGATLARRLRDDLGGAGLWGSRA